MTAIDNSTRILIFHQPNKNFHATNHENFVSPWQFVTQSPMGPLVWIHPRGTCRPRPTNAMSIDLHTNLMMFTLLQNHMVLAIKYYIQVYLPLFTNVGSSSHVKFSNSLKDYFYFLLDSVFGYICNDLTQICHPFLLMFYIFQRTNLKIKLEYTFEKLKYRIWLYYRDFQHTSSTTSWKSHKSKSRRYINFLLNMYCIKWHLTP